MESGKKQPRHFVLVHGLGHGRGAGTRWQPCCGPPATASPRSTFALVRVEEVRSLDEYNRPLIDAVAAVPPGEKVVLVGHSYGGHSLSLLMQTCPHKVAVAVFVSAFMPVAGTPMPLLLEQNLKGMKEMPPDFMLDSTFEIIENAGNNPVETFLPGPECMSQRLYQLSPPEDLTLATMLVRPGQVFRKHDAVKTESVLTEDKYGAVSRVYVVTEEDKTFPAEEQRRLASFSPGVEVRAIEGADHMAMHSKPVELSELLMEIADKYN